MSTMRQTQDKQKASNVKSVVIVALMLLLVAVLGFGGYTLSKYLTSKSETGSASVAKWGFTVTTDASKLFGTNYTFETNNSVVTDGNANLTVKASDTNNRVAPGTTGSMTIKISGEAEVLAQVNLAVKDGFTDVVLKYTKDGVAGTDYAPVKWSLEVKSDSLTSGATAVTDGTLAEVVAELVKVNGTKVEAGTDVNQEYVISWKWDFGTAEVTENDYLDTVLGMYAKDAASVNGATDNAHYVGGAAKYVAVTGTNTQINFELTAGVTQLQK